MGLLNSPVEIEPVPFYLLYFRSVSVIVVCVTAADLKPYSPHTCVNVGLRNSIVYSDVESNNQRITVKHCTLKQNTGEKLHDRVVS